MGYGTGNHWCTFPAVFYLVLAHDWIGNDFILAVCVSIWQEMVEELSRRGHRTSEEDTRGGAVYGISVVGDDDDGGCHLYANADYRKGGDVAGFWWCASSSSSQTNKTRKQKIWFSKQNILDARMNQIEKEEWRHSRLQSFMSREAAAAETGKQIKEITEWTIRFLFLSKK